MNSSETTEIRSETNSNISKKRKFYLSLMASEQTLKKIRKVNHNREFLFLRNKNVYLK